MHFTWDCYRSFYRISQRLCLTQIPHFPKHLCSWFESFFQPQGWPKDTTETTRMEQTTATMGNWATHSFRFIFGCLRPSKSICNLETVLWHSVWNSPCCDWTSAMPNSPRHEAVAGSCPAGAHLCETICSHLPQRKSCGSSPVASGHVIGERCLNRPFRRCATTAFRPQNRKTKEMKKKNNETTLTTATWGARFQQLLHHELTGWGDLIQGNSRASGLLPSSRSTCFPSSRFRFGAEAPLCAEAYRRQFPQFVAKRCIWTWSQFPLTKRRVTRKESLQWLA